MKYSTGSSGLAGLASRMIPNCLRKKKDLTMPVLRSEEDSSVEVASVELDVGGGVAASVEVEEKPAGKRRVVGIRWAGLLARREEAVNLEVAEPTRLISNLLDMVTAFIGSYF